MTKLSEIVKVKISKDPLLTFDREVIATEFYVNDNQIDLVTFAYYFKDDEPISVQRIKPLMVKLSAQNSTLVNPQTGGTVEDGESEEDCTMGEYDYLTMVADNPLNIFDLMKSVIARADARGRYNK